MAPWLTLANGRLSPVALEQSLNPLDSFTNIKRDCVWLDFGKDTPDIQTQNDFQVSAKETEHLCSEWKEQTVRHVGERDHEEGGPGDPPEHHPDPIHDPARARRYQYWYF